MTVSEISEVMDGWEDMNGILKIEGNCYRGCAHVRLMQKETDCLLDE